MAKDKCDEEKKSLQYVLYVYILCRFLASLIVVMVYVNKRDFVFINRDGKRPYTYVYTPIDIDERRLWKKEE